MFYVQFSYSMCSFRVRECPSMRFEVRRNLDFATVRTKLPTELDGFATKKHWFPAAILDDTLNARLHDDVREQTDQHEDVLQGRHLPSTVLSPPGPDRTFSHSQHPTALCQHGHQSQTCKKLQKCFTTG